ncbi:MAG TPA: hypothetical protein VHE53_00360 [Patescibacteria group bacterium]|nr:hypothetical protein [Patescibacteria group bacterium]
MRDREPSMYGALTDKAVRGMHELLDSLEKQHPHESELARSGDPHLQYIATRMREKRLKGHNMEYVFNLPPTFENLALLTRVEDYEQHP